MKKIYIIGIGGIGISGIARYYHHIGYQVFGSDSTESELIQNLKKEGINIIIGEDENNIDATFEKIIYTQAIPENQKELLKAKTLKIPTLTYPESLAEVFNEKKGIAIAGTHGKSTTTSMLSLIMKDSLTGLNSIVGSLLREFGGKNSYFSQSDYFTIEACEYKRSFLQYQPSIGVITNIELDHLDYYKDLEDYIYAFEEFINNIKSGGYIFLNGNCKNSLTLVGKRDDIEYILIYDEYYLYRGEKIFFKKLKLKIPGEHIEFDAKLAYSVGEILKIDSEKILSSLNNYNGIWRRSEVVGKTLFDNILMSDYGHHPTEIILNLKALQTKYKKQDKDLVTIFQPHQYSRTLELLQDFKNAFIHTDMLIVPNIFQSRDSKEDMEKIDGKKFLQSINHRKKVFGNGFQNTLDIIKKLDEDNPSKYVFLLLGAGDIDNLRYDIKLKK